MKNVFFSFWKNLIFCPGFFNHAGKRFDQKAKLNFKMYDVTDLNTNNYNISRSKSNQTMKFGQLIVYNMRNPFLEESSTKSAEEVTSTLFLKKKSKFSIYLDQQSQILYSLLLLYIQVDVYQNILKLRC